MAGNRTLLLSFDGANVSAVPVRVLPGRAHAAACEAEGAGVVQATAGAPATFTVVARDAYGNEMR